MDLPPGPVYLFRNLPYFLGPPIVTYGLLRIAKNELNAPISTYFIVFLALLSRPFLVLFNRHYARFKEHKGAVAANAFVIPHVEGGLSALKELGESMESGFPGEKFMEWAGKYGPTFQVRLPTDNLIFTTDPDHVKAILSTQFDIWEKGEHFKSVFHTLLGEGIFNVNGDTWKFHRSMTRPFFTKDRISDFENFDIHAEEALRQAKARLSEGYPIDFQDLVSRFTLDSSSQFLFGHDIRSLDAGLPYPAFSQRDGLATRSHPSDIFVNAFMDGQIVSAKRQRLGLNWPLAEFWKDKAKPYRKAMDDVLESVLDRAINNAEIGKGLATRNDGEEDTLLEHLVHHTKDKKLIMDEVLNLLVAGRDTTAALLTFCFYMLSEHPGVENRLRQEILEKVGPDGKPTYTTLREMKYLRAFINEVLRFYPIVPFDGRMATKDTVLTSKVPGSRSLFVPANTRIVYVIIALQRRTDLWGPDGTLPDNRFPRSLTTHCINVQQHISSIPIGFWMKGWENILLTTRSFSVRSMLALEFVLVDSFAYQEASYFLVRLFQQFKNFRLEPSAQPENSLPPANWADGPAWKAREKVYPFLHLTMSVRGGLWVKMDPV